MINNPLLEKEYNLWILLNHTRHAIYRAREMELSRYGITVEQARLLFVVNALKNQAIPTEIAKYLFRKSHTISSLIDRMEKRGLVKREKDPGNKKIVRVVLTPKGRETLKNTLLMQSIQEIMAGLSEEQLDQMESCLGILMQRASREIGWETNGILRETISETG